MNTINKSSAAKNAWAFWEKTYGPLLNTILTRIDKESKAGLVSMTEIIPIGGLLFIKRELENKGFSIRSNTIFVDDDVEDVETIILTIEWI